jgi:hypothetical protein
MIRNEGIAGEGAAVIIAASRLGAGWKPRHALRAGLVCGLLKNGSAARVLGYFFHLRA